MKAFVAMMNQPDNHDPRNNITADRKCTRGPKRFSPKRKRPRKVDSAKKANMPSMAKVVPMTPPAKAENRAQLVPNWNSSGMPVTTPIAKLRPKMRPQKRAAWL